MLIILTAVVISLFSFINDNDDISNIDNDISGNINTYNIIMLAIIIYGTDDDGGGKDDNNDKNCSNNNK